VPSRGRAWDSRHHVTHSAGNHLRHDGDREYFSRHVKPRSQLLLPVIRKGITKSLYPHPQVGSEDGTDDEPSTAELMLSYDDQLPPLPNPASRLPPSAKHVIGVSSLVVEKDSTESLIHQKQKAADGKRQVAEAAAKSKTREDAKAEEERASDAANKKMEKEEKQVQLKLVFDTEFGDETVWATRGPLGVNFDMEDVPLMVIGVDEGSHGEEIGIMMDWILKSVDDVDVYDAEDVDEAFGIFTQGIRKVT
jgi:hypothetical protein